MASPPGKITFGQQLRSLEAGGFIFTETYHPPGLELARHDHECANFNLTVRGRCRETMRGRSEEHGPSSLVIKPPGEAHANRYGASGARSLIVEVTPARLASLAPRERLFQVPQTLRHGPLVALATRMHAELRADAGASELVLEGLALEFVGLLARDQRPTKGAMPRWLREGRDEIHASFATRLGLSSLAASVGVDASYFARAFRAWFGCSVGAYIRRLRLRYAAEQLAGSRRSLAEVALAAGFCDQSHLTNAFKLHFGMTPAAYREATAADAPGTRRSTESRLT